MFETIEVTFEILDQRLKDYDLNPATEGSAGIDLRACIEEPLDLQPDMVKLIPSGIKVKIPDDHFVGLIAPRSGLGHKGLVIGNLVGFIDADYTGELKISLWNRTKEIITVQPMDRVAQFLIVPRLKFKLKEGIVEEDIRRGGKGFCSSGVK